MDHGTHTLSYNKGIHIYLGIMQYERNLRSLFCSYASYLFFLLPLCVLVVVSLLLDVFIVKSIVHCPWLVLLQYEIRVAFALTQLPWPTSLVSTCACLVVFECFVFFAHPGHEALLKV